jgi:arabinogalactan oligomer/maltooligosaccharide transport system substrate-binding protein
MSHRARFGVLLATIAIIATACSTSTTPAPTAGPTAGPTAAPATALKGTLTVWESYGSGAGTEPDAFRAIVAQIKAANPDLVLNVQDVKFDDLFKNFELDAASGGGPDLFIAPNDSLGKEARAKLFLPLDDKLAGKLPNASQISIDGSKVNDKFYMVPESLKTVTMFYDSAKVTKVPTTTAELLAAVKDGSVKLGINQGSYHNYGWWGAFGGKLMDSVGKCIADQAGVADSYKYLQDLKAAGATFYKKYDDFATAFKTGKINLIIDGPWATGGYQTALPKLAVAPMPAGPAGPAQPLTGVDGWYINANTKNADLAVAFALEFVKPANEALFVKAGHIPADTTVAITDPITLKFADAVKTGFPRPQAAQLDNFWGNFDNALNSVIDKGTDPVTATKDACTAMNTANKIP